MYVYNNGVYVKAHCYNVGKEASSQRRGSKRQVSKIGCGDSWCSQVHSWRYLEGKIKSKHTLAPAAIHHTQRSAVLCGKCTFRSSMKLALFGFSNIMPRELWFLGLCCKRNLASCLPPSTLTKILSRLVWVGCISFVNIMEFFFVFFCLYAIIQDTQ